MSASITRGRVAPLAGAAAVAVIAVVGVSYAAGSHSGPTGQGQGRAHPAHQDARHDAHHGRVATTSGGKVMLGM
jgi:hypothetical protein